MAILSLEIPFMHAYKNLYNQENTYTTHMFSVYAIFKLNVYPVHFFKKIILFTVDTSQTYRSWSSSIPIT